MRKYMTIDPKNFGYEEAITDKKNPIFRVYKKTLNKGEELLAVLTGKNGVALLKHEL